MSQPGIAETSKQVQTSMLLSRSVSECSLARYTGYNCTNVVASLMSGQSPRNTADKER